MKKMSPELCSALISIMTGVIECDLQRGKSFGVHKSDVKSSKFQFDDSWRRVQALVADAYFPISQYLHTLSRDALLARGNLVHI